MSQEEHNLAIINRIWSMEEVIDRLELKVDSLEHWDNQQSILVDTLGKIMEELKRQEP